MAGRELSAERLVRDERDAHRGKVEDVQNQQVHRRGAGEAGRVVADVRRALAALVREEEARRPEQQVDDDQSARAHHDEGSAAHRLALELPAARIAQKPDQRVGERVERDGERDGDGDPPQRHAEPVGVELLHLPAAQVPHHVEAERRPCVPVRHSKARHKAKQRKDQKRQRKWQEPEPRRRR